MSTEPEVEVDLVIAHRVATITINRPQARNSITWDTIRELRRTIDDAGNDDDVRVIVLRGAGDKAFCSGADLSTMRKDATSTDLHEARGELAKLFRDLWQLGKPTIARVQGFALAGGLGLALACDVVVASDTAVFGTPEIDVGLWPFMVTVPMLRSMPPKVALEMMMTGRRVSAREGQRLGFVNMVVPDIELDKAVNDITRSLTNKAPHAMRVGRESFYRALDMESDEALAFLHPLLSVTAEGEEAAEGIAAFNEKRKPNWQQ